MLCIFSAGVAAQTGGPGAAAAPYDRDEALALSQAAIGRRLSDFRFLDENARPVKLSDYRGMPVIISMIYSSCYHTCPLTTQFLKTAVRAARDALGGRPVQVLSIGFDVPTDNPQSMAAFRRTQAIDTDRWAFLSGDKDTIEALIRELGFIYYPSPRGYDHLVQASVLDDKGVLYRQVYGETFELPWLVEPLMEIVFKERRGIGQLLNNISNRIILFCTLYDPASGRYRYDFSLFIGMTIGAMIILTGISFLAREAWRARALKVNKSA
jgi:protein SCO1/2